MARYIPHLLLIGTVCIFAALLLIVTDPTGHILRQRDLQRQKDLVEIATQIEKYAKETGSIPGFSVDYQQIGTEKTGCAIENSHCSIKNDECINAHMVMGKKTLSLPSDLKIGTYKKTGYAAKFDTQNEVVTIVACGVEGDTELSAEQSVKGLLASPSPVPVQN
jgi:hypothetical protein